MSGNYRGQDRTEKELSSEELLSDLFDDSNFSTLEKLRNFPKYVTRQTLTRFLCKNELMKKIIEVDGSIVECGVFYGGGTMTWGHLSSIYEPVNYTRKIYGFDTFSGFPSLNEKDKNGNHIESKVGGLSVNSYEELLECISLFDKNRNIGHINKIKLIKGDANKTIPQFIDENPHIVISLLYLDFDIYEPTLTALQNFYPRMPKGGIIAFDELNNPHWPGETQAVFDFFKDKKLEIKRFPFNSYISYTVIE